MRLMTFRTMSTMARTIACPQYKGASQRPTPVVPKTTFAALHPPPNPSCPNRLPDRTPQRPPSGFESSRHIIPAAFPRTFTESTGNLERESKPFTAQPRKGGESAEERKERNLKEARACVRIRFDAKPLEEGARDQPGLWLAGERWIRTQNGSGEEGLTLVLSAANGFTKETWMPTIHRLLNNSIPKQTFGQEANLPPILHSTRIDEIWFLDDYHHGQSMDLNKGIIGPVHSWLDGGRDIVNFIKHVLPDERNPSETLTWRRNPTKRKVIGLGHSVGGNAMVRAAQFQPELFHAIFLVEPMTPPLHATPSQLWGNQWQEIFFRPIITMRRRATWSSMSEALKVRSTPFFSSWHDEVFQTWQTYHLVPTSYGQGVTLATPAWAEAAVFSETTGLAEGWDALPELKVPCGFLMAGDAQSTMGEKLTQEMVWRPPMAANERIMDAGHLIVHEKPDQVADAIGRFLHTIQRREERAKL